MASGRRACILMTNEHPGAVVRSDPRVGSTLLSSFPQPGRSHLSPPMLAEVTLELFQRRTAGPLIVCRDAGVQHADQDLTDERAYESGEIVDLRFFPTLSVSHPGSLRADVVANGDRITVRARHDVFVHGGQALVSSGQVFDVDRRCIFAVWR